MAEFEEAAEAMEEALEGIDGEAAEGAEEGLDAEEVKELEAEAAVARENVSTLQKVVDYFRGLATPETLADFSKFVVKNVAVGAIFFGVTLALNKLVKVTSSKGGDTTAAKDKVAKITALTTLISDITTTSKTTMTWLTDHEKDRITLDGIEVPLIDIFSKYTGPMGDAVKKAFDVAKELQTTTDGKAGFKTPTTDQVTTAVSASEAYVTQFDLFVKFAEEKKADFPVLASLPVSQSDIDKLTSDLQKVKDLPYYT